MLWLTLAVCGALVAVLGVPAAMGALADRLGDTDDALRLVLVRDLIQGHAGWYEQHFTRLQPPLGMDLHWSRLVDGGIAAVELGFRLFLSPAKAEYAARVTWPLLWLAPAVAAIISVARQLRGDNAAIACAAVLAVNYLLFAQWSAGRIDHHDLQMTAAFCALAGAMSNARSGAVLAGLATAAGLAVGLEALVFLGAVGTFYALRFVLDPARHASQARAYAGSLLAGVVVLYLIETPPAWWGVARCDTLGANLTLAVAVACLSLLGLSRFAGEARPGLRFVGLGAAGVLAIATYVALQPACLHGPFALSDARIKPIWLSKVSEMQPLLGRLRSFEFEPINGLVLMVLGLLSWAWLGRRRELRSGAWLIAGACFLSACAAGLWAVRLSGYTCLFAVPLVAAAAADLASHYRRNSPALPVALVVALSPAWPVAWLTNLAPTSLQSRVQGQLACTAPSAYAALAKLPTGVVLSEIDLGPYILASTSHAVLAAPYHRADWGILAADAALAAPPGPDEAAVRRLKANYVVNCRAHAWYPRRKEIGLQSLQVRLDRGQPSTWLQPLSGPNEPLQVYRVLPSRTVVPQEAVKAGR